jgi:predicted PhzF superfamily epimerase YddE/YHI9
MPQLHVLRVFTDADGREGNPLGVFLDGDEVPMDARQAVAADLGFSETVFVDDRERAELRIFTPVAELPLAGHPLVGTAWLLDRRGTELEVLRPPAGEIPAWREGEETWFRGAPGSGPPWDLVELPSPADIDALEGSPHGLGKVMVWSWQDEAAGVVRARVFGGQWGVPEDPATGSAAMRLCPYLGRAVTIVQGAGCIVKARLAEAPGLVEIGGLTELEDVRAYELKSG